ncbi:choice-of-anchor D domain-containing protein [Flammeovirga sp. EKP202]|nr:choice-of-anchor D domain-containing protein [Flammeovirga sp. EKP202]
MTRNITKEKRTLYKEWAIALVFTFTSLLSYGQGGTYYVSETGSDNNDGLTAETALASVHKFFDLYVNNAITHSNAVYMVNISGAVKFSNDQAGEKPIKDNENVTITFKGDNVATTTISPYKVVSEAEYGRTNQHGRFMNMNDAVNWTVIFEDLTIRNFGLDGKNKNVSKGGIVWSNKENTKVTFRNCHIENGHARSGALVFFNQKGCEIIMDKVYVNNITVLQSGNEIEPIVYMKTGVMNIQNSIFNTITKDYTPVHAFGSDTPADENAAEYNGTVLGFEMAENGVASTVTLLNNSFVNCTAVNDNLGDFTAFNNNYSGDVISVGNSAVAILGVNNNNGTNIGAINIANNVFSGTTGDDIMINNNTWVTLDLFTNNVMNALGYNGDQSANNTIQESFTADELTVDNTVKQGANGMPYLEISGEVIGGKGATGALIPTTDITGATRANPPGIGAFDVAAPVVLTKILKISTDPIDFGTVTIADPQETVDKTLLIENIGTAALTITDIAVANPFELDVDLINPLVIEAGGSENVVITFNPTVADNYSEELTITSDDTEGSANKVILNAVASILQVTSFTLSDDVNFGTVVIGETKTAEITVSNTGNTDLIFLGTDASFSNSNYISHNIPAEGLSVTAGNTAKITLTLNTSTAAATSYNTTFTLSKNDVDASMTLSAELTTDSNENEFYVSALGDDSNDGLSSNQALKTFAAALGKINETEEIGGKTFTINVVGDNQFTYTANGIRPVAKNTTIIFKGSGADVSSISGGFDADYAVTNDYGRLLDLTGNNTEGIKVIFQDLTLKNFGSNLTRDGGLIYANGVNQTVTFNQCHIYNVHSRSGAIAHFQTKENRFEMNGCFVEKATALQHTEVGKPIIYAEMIDMSIKNSIFSDITKDYTPLSGSVEEAIYNGIVVGSILSRISSSTLNLKKEFTMVNNTFVNCKTINDDLVSFEKYNEDRNHGYPGDFINNNSVVALLTNKLGEFDNHKYTVNIANNLFVGNNGASATSNENPEYDLLINNKKTIEVNVISHNILNSFGYVDQGNLTDNTIDATYTVTSSEINFNVQNEDELVIYNDASTKVPYYKLEGSAIVHAGLTNAVLVPLTDISGQVRQTPPSIGAYEYIPQGGQITAGSTLEFTDLARSATVTKGLEITNSGNQPLSITAVQITGEGYSILNAPTAEAPLSIAVGSTETVTVQLVTGPTAKVYEGTISINSDAININPLEIAVTGEVEGDRHIELSTSAVVFPTTLVDASAVTSVITFTNEGLDDLSVNELTVSAPFGFVVEGNVVTTLPAFKVLANSGTKEITVAFEPKAEGDFTETLTFPSNASTVTSNTLNLSGKAIVPVFQVSGDTDYNYIGDGTSKTTTLTFTNNTDQPVTFMAEDFVFETTPSYITIDLPEEGLVIDANGTGDIALTFAPVDLPLGTYTNKLTVTKNEFSKAIEITAEVVEKFEEDHFYVSATGNDDSDGLTSGTALKSFEKVFTLIGELEEKYGKTFTINVIGDVLYTTGGAGIRPNASNSTIVLKGEGANISSISGGLDAEYTITTDYGRFLDLSGNTTEGIKVIFEDLTIKNFGSYGQRDGGVVYANGANQTVIFNQCHIYNGHAKSGAIVHFQTKENRFEMNGCFVEKATAIQSNGVGGPIVYGEMTDMSIKNSIFSDITKDYTPLSGSEEDATYNGIVIGSILSRISNGIVDYKKEFTMINNTFVNCKTINDDQVSFIKFNEDKNHGYPGDFINNNSVVALLTNKLGEFDNHKYTVNIANNLFVGNNGSSASSNENPEYDLLINNKKTIEVNVISHNIMNSFGYVDQGNLTDNTIDATYTITSPEINFDVENENELVVYDDASTKVPYYKLEGSAIAVAGYSEATLVPNVDISGQERKSPPSIGAYEYIPQGPQIAAETLDFATVERSSTIVKELTISNAGTMTLTISAMTIEGVGYSLVDFEAPLAIDPEESKTVQVQLTTGEVPAIYNGTVTMTSDAISGSEYNVVLKAEVEGDRQIALSTDKIEFPEHDVDKIAPVSVITFTNNGIDPLTVEDITVAAPYGFMIEDKIELTYPSFIVGPNNGTVEVTVVFDPTEQGDYIDTLFVASNAVNSKQDTIALSGTATVAPVRIVGDLDFQTVSLNSTKEISLEITNNSEEAITFFEEDFELSKAEFITFDLGEAGLLVATGETVSLPFSFTPVDVTLGAYTNQLVITKGEIRKEIAIAANIVGEIKENTYFVSTSGDDSNDGVTEGTAFLTFEKAINVMNAIEEKEGKVFTINVVDDVRHTALSSGITPKLKNAELIIKGLGADVSSISIGIDDDYSTENDYGRFLNLSGGDSEGMRVVFQDLTLKNFGSHSLDVAKEGGIVYVNGVNQTVVFNQCHIYNIHSRSGAIIHFNTKENRFEMNGCFVEKATGLQADEVGRPIIYGEMTEMSIKNSIFSDITKDYTPLSGTVEEATYNGIVIGSILSRITSSTLNNKNVFTMVNNTFVNCKTINDDLVSFEKYNQDRNHGYPGDNINNNAVVALLTNKLGEVDGHVYIANIANNLFVGNNGSSVTSNENPEYDLLINNKKTLEVNVISHNIMNTFGYVDQGELSDNTVNSNLTLSSDEIRFDLNEDNSLVVYNDALTKVPYFNAKGSALGKAGLADDTLVPTVDIAGRQRTNPPTIGAVLLVTKPEIAVVEVLDFGTRKSNDTANELFLPIANNGTADLVISNITIANDTEGIFEVDFEAPFSIAAGQTEQVKVIFNTGTVSDVNYTANITIESNDKNVNVVVKGATSDSIEFIKIELFADTEDYQIGDPVQFGDYILNETLVTRNIYITNKLGSDPLNVTAVEMPFGFELVSGQETSFTVNAEDTVMLEVVFNPTIVDVYSGSMTVVSNYTAGINTILLEGEALSDAPLEISLTGDYMNVEGDTLNFDLLYSGDSINTDVVISNDFFEAIQIDSIVISNNDSLFLVHDFSTTSKILEIGDSFTLNMIYTPRVTEDLAYETTMTLYGTSESAKGRAVRKEVKVRAFVLTNPYEKEDPTSIEDELLHVKVYPNPAKDFITIEIANASLIGEKISLISIQGMEVRIFTINSMKQTFDLSGLSSGVYVLRTQNKVISRLVVKP